MSDLLSRLTETAISALIVAYGKTEKLISCEQVQQQAQQHQLHLQ
jgi:hypothetical protein